MGTIDDYRKHWMPMPVPGTWAEGSRGVLKDFAGPAWYRCLFRAPQEWRDRPTVLRIGAPAGHLRAWVNGEPVRFISFNELKGMYFASGAIGLDAGDANLVVIRVDRVPDDAVIGPVSLVSIGGGQRDDEADCSGAWQFRIGDDPDFATLPLPAKFAASTDFIFEPSHDP